LCYYILKTLGEVLIREQLFMTDTKNPSAASLTADIQTQASNAVAGISIPAENTGAEAGPWEKFGLSREQASAKAMNAINAELGTLAASRHDGWNAFVDIKMMQDGGDPAALWAMYQKLVKADTTLELEGTAAVGLRPTATPAVAASKAKDESPTLSA